MGLGWVGNAVGAPEAEVCVRVQIKLRAAAGRAPELRVQSLVWN